MAAKASPEPSAWGEKWCILRTNGRNTLRLATSLRLAGIDAWTPRLRSNDEKPLPLTPSFVFARSAYLSRLLVLASLPGKAIGFSVFHDAQRVPLVKDSEIARLRMAERMSIPRRKRVTLEVGDRVRIPEGSGAGMVGAVIRSDGKITELDCGGAMRVKISTFILLDDVACEPSLAA
jgi:hypothetical protein